MACRRDRAIATLAQHLAKGLFNGTLLSIISDVAGIHVCIWRLYQSFILSPPPFWLQLQHFRDAFKNILGCCRPRLPPWGAFPAAP